MISIIALAVIISPPIPPEIISAKTFAEMISGKGLGVVSVSRSLEKVEIYAEARCASAAQLVQAVATGLHASVIQTPSGILIERTKKDVESIEKSLSYERKKWLKDRLGVLSRYRATNLDSHDQASSLRRSLDAYFTQWKNPGKMPQQANSSLRATQLLPSETFLEHLIQRIGIDNLAAVPNGNLQVFEDHPTISAIGLPPCEDLIDEFLQARSSLSKFTLPDNLRNILPAIGMGDMIETSLTEIPSHLRLEVASHSGGIEIQFQGFDSAGKQVVHAWLLAGRVDQPLVAKSILENALKSKERKELRLPDQTTQAIQFLDGKTTTTPPPSWFLRPEENEPLNMFARPVLQNIAEEDPGKCFVAVVSDLMLSPVRRSMRDGKLLLDAFNRLLDQSMPYEFIKSPESVIWRPTDPISDEQKVANRNVLGKFARKEKLGLACDVRTLGLLCHDVAQGFSPLADAWALRIQAGSPLLSGSGSFSGYALKLVGGVDEPTWLRLKSVNSLSCAEIGAEPELQALLRNDWGLQVTGRDTVPDLYRHPLELYPHTPLGESPLSFQPITTPMVAWYQAEGSTPSLMPQSQIKNIFQLQLWNSVKWVGDSPSFTMTRDAFEQKFSAMRFRYGTKINQRLTIFLPQGFSISFEAPQSISFDDEFLTYSDLPQQDRDLYWQTTVDQSLVGARNIRQSMLAPKPKIDEHTTGGTPPPQ